MKNLLTILALFAAMLAGAAQVTYYTYQFQNADGSPVTNQFTLQGWPAATSQVTIVSNSVVFSGGIITNTPNANGTGTNSILPNNYRVFVPDLNLGFLVNIPVTSQTNTLASYAVGTPVVYLPASQYAYLTNQLGFAPATNTSQGIVSALGYTPITNSYAALTNVAGFVFATNNPATNIIAYVSAVSGVTNGSGLVTNLSVTLTTNTLNYIHK
jgi:hypothetical protein